MSRHVSFTITSESGKFLKFENRACFSMLRDINSGISMYTKGVWPSLDEDPITTITIHPANEGNLPLKVIDNYMDYLYNHHFWGKMLGERGTSTLSDVVIPVSNHSGVLLLSLCVLVRNVNEIPAMVESFYNITSLDYVENEDIALLLSNFIYFSEGGLTLSMQGHSIGFNSNHHIIKSSHTLEDIIDYASIFPYVDESPSFIESYKFTGNDKYFSRNDTPRTISSFVRKVTPSIFKEEFIKMQEEVKRARKSKEE